MRNSCLPGGLWGRASHLTGRKGTEVWQMGTFKIHQGVSQGLDSQKEVIGCYWDCWSPGEADGRVYVLYSLFWYFSVFSQKDPISHVLKEILSLCTFNPNGSSPVNSFYKILINLFAFYFLCWLTHCLGLNFFSCWALRTSPLSFLCDHLHLDVGWIPVSQKLLPMVELIVPLGGIREDGEGLTDLHT